MVIRKKSLQRQKAFYRKRVGKDSKGSGSLETESRKWGISGFGLKMIAVVTMLIDHTAAVVLWRILSSSGVFPTVDENWEDFYNLYQIMRRIGRMAFPIYCYLLVEGFSHSRNLQKYTKRLLVFALISEIPFDLAFNSTVLEFSYNNVFWTLWIGLVMMRTLQWVERKTEIQVNQVFVQNFLYFCRGLVCIAIVLCAMGLAEFVFQTDYGAAGVAAVACMYFLRSYPMWGFGAAVGVLAILSSGMELFALLMLVPLYFYDGTRGKQLKYFFYAFYPVHLAVLVALTVWMGLLVIA